MPRNIVGGALVARAQAARISGLVALRDAFSSMADPDLASFHDAVASLLVLDVDASTVSRKAKVSVSVVTRWSRGETNPHPLMRASIMPLLAEVATDEIAAASAALRLAA